VAVFVGGALQLAVQLPALARIGMLPRLSGLRTAFADPDVRRILVKMGPAVFAVSVAQVSLIINTNIASHLGEGANAWLYFADRLMEFPTALLGVALATVLVPSLSKAFSQARHEDYSRMLDWGLRLTCLIALPAAVGLGLLAEGLIAVLFQGGQFGPRDVAQTALALTGYAFGLLGLIAVKILAPGFYAQQDIKTPVKIAVAVLIATQVANLALVPWLAHAGLAWSVSLGALANAALLYAGLRRRGSRAGVDSWRALPWPCCCWLRGSGGPTASSTGSPCTRRGSGGWHWSRRWWRRRWWCISAPCCCWVSARATFGCGSHEPAGPPQGRIPERAA
jgi:putative peptidoglycan lipid II flippase